MSERFKPQFKCKCSNTKNESNKRLSCQPCQWWSTLFTPSLLCVFEFESFLFLFFAKLKSKKGNSFGHAIITFSFLEIPSTMMMCCLFVSEIFWAIFYPIFKSLFCNSVSLTSISFHFFSFLLFLFIQTYFCPTFSFQSILIPFIVIKFNCSS